MLQKFKFKIETIKMSEIKNYEKIKQPELAKHDSSVLDLAFAMDCTGSMGSYIYNATNVSLNWLFWFADLFYLLNDIHLIEHS